MHAMAREDGVTARDGVNDGCVRPLDVGPQLWSLGDAAPPSLVGMHRRQAVEHPGEQFDRRVAGELGDRDVKILVPVR